MTSNEHKREQQDMFVRALIESQQQQEQDARRKKKQEEKEASNNWKIENRRRWETETAVERTERGHGSEV